MRRASDILATILLRSRTCKSDVSWLVLGIEGPVFLGVLIGLPGPGLLLYVGCGRMVSRTLEERFWEKVSKASHPKGCWEWVGSRTHHYGRIRRGGRGTPILQANRVAWELTYGPIPDGLDVCHKCDNPPCVNPDHLFLGDAKANMADMLAKGRCKRATGDRASARLYPERVPRGEKHHLAVLTALKVRAIRSLHKLGWSNADLARLCNVTRANIRCIVTGKSWKHVKY